MSTDRFHPSPGPSVGTGSLTRAAFVQPPVDRDIRQIESDDPIERADPPVDHTGRDPHVAPFAHSSRTPCSHADAPRPATSSPTTIEPASPGSSPDPNSTADDSQADPHPPTRARATRPWPGQYSPPSFHWRAPNGVGTLIGQGIAATGLDIVEVRSTTAQPARGPSSLPVLRSEIARSSLSVLIYIPTSWYLLGPQAVERTLR